ncbi:DUF3048 domain-containing protein [Metabacillus iocasae]|uniref:Lipoprotein YerB n=1 Tax=Priestia iocasae TaxID=2291674 RepID=A0ABS2QXN7_9BACI|nr:DUF3048 domain-containing protein [Metabacillus iocasae]MBM7704246.1 hypothetical protein [Metabacillus iocasae]
MKYLLFISLAMLVLSGCQKDERVQGEQPQEVVEEFEADEPSEEQPKEVAPLTGLPVQTESNHRAVAVMINNDPKARPQSGLKEADLVYELLAEGSITRFMAIYQSEKPKRIGPVRSARDYYVELSKGYDALYVSHGWSPKAKEMLEAGEADSLNGLFYDGTLFKRSKDRKAPHNSYITYENIEKGAEEKGYSMKDHVKSLSFVEEGSVSGEKASRVTVKHIDTALATVYYRYDQKEEKYIRSDGKKDTMDAESKDLILLDNVLIIEAEHEIIDNQGRREINVTSGGKGYLLQKGVAQEVEWKNRNGRLLPYKDGKIQPFIKGKTWINIISTSPGIDGGVLIES